MSKLLTINIIRTGLQTTIQDLGRPNYQSSGIPLGGALDRMAAIQANYLVENPLDAPVLEVTLLGPKLQFSESCQIALSGADLSAKVNGQTIARYATISIEPGDLLSFGKAHVGCRAYLAIRGTWIIQKWLGSASLATQHPEKLTPDSLLSTGKIIQIEIPENIPPRQLKARHFSYLTDTSALKALPGPDFLAFDRKTIARFFAQTYRLGTASNRMGCRLEPSLEGYSWPRENISSGIVPGTVQMTNEGQAIVLLADAQTIGGYPRIVNLTEESLQRIAQLRPGAELRFSLIDYQ
ncbi:MAG: biotin-dependent carboxyltransferase family protein [Saprospiraceae bacterium]